MTGKAIPVKYWSLSEPVNDGPIDAIISSRREVTVSFTRKVTRSGEIKSGWVDQETKRFVKPIGWSV